MSMQSDGGKARMSKLSKKDRSALGKRAAEVRWANREKKEVKVAKTKSL